jgi:hypothetical protein
VAATITRAIDPKESKRKKKQQFLIIVHKKHDSNNKSLSYAHTRKQRKTKKMVIAAATRTTRIFELIRAVQKNGTGERKKEGWLACVRQQLAAPAVPVGK